MIEELESVMIVNDNKQQLREALKKQREKELKRSRMKKTIIGSIAGLVIAAIIGVIAWSIVQSAGNETNGEQLAPTKADANGAFHISSGGAVIEDVAPTGQTRVDMFFDPMCPGCGLVDRGIGERLNQLVDDGEVDLYMTPVAFLDHASSDKYSTRAVNATITVAEEAPEYYMAFVNTLYEEGHQPAEGASYVSVTDGLLAERAVAVGVPEEVAAKFSEGLYYDWIAENTNKQLNQREDLFPDGFSTPAVFLNIEYEDKETNTGKVSDYTRVEFDNAEIQQTFDTALEQVEQ